ncbi:MAG: phosphatase PAP2 family protein [Ilumatobacteraceae bacterium]
MLRGLTQCANHGKLWFGIAAAGMVAGGRYRRAAIRATGSLGIASLVTNTLIKPLVGRRRPDLGRIVLARQITKQPWTSSFPSGHAASAAAFATAVAIEAPGAGAALAPLAAAVDYSRVHVGVHHRSDVLVGSGVGIAVALTVKKLWPVREEAPAETLPAQVPTLAGGRGLTVVVNRASGSADDAGQKIGALLPEARIVQWDPDDGPDVLSSLVTDGVQALGVAGGDGTCASVAGVALQHDVPLAVFAAGTLNHFAKSLGLLQFSDTARSIENGCGGAVDVAQLDGVPFLNTASIGMYPEFVAARDRLSPAVGKVIAALVALPRTLRAAAPIQITLNGTQTNVWTVFIGNGHYTPRGLVSSRREHMADGLIDVQIVYASSRFSRVRATVGSLLGHIERSGVYGSMHTRSLDIQMDHDEVMVAHDGEITDPKRSARIDLASRRLRVYRTPPVT